MKSISVLGSTGSIGTQTLDVVRQNGDIKIAALAVNSNISLLLEQIREFKPSAVCVFDETKAIELSGIVKSEGLKCEVLSGMEGLISCACISEVSLVVTAFVGMIGIRPTIEAIKAGKNIALANKETMVTAGHILMPLAKEYRVEILPVDSEHSAIFQCLMGAYGNKPTKILLTASGGPFRGLTRAEMAGKKPEDALKHPNWTMGRKITIDSATMVNKGLEIMEAKWLFEVEPHQVQVVIQPQSIIHSMVQFSDGAVMAQLGTPDMKLPIQLALYYPERKGITSKPLDFSTMGHIQIYAPDFENFPALRMAYEALEIGGSMPTVYNAVNEIAVAKFLNREIGFNDITDLISYEMDKHILISNPSLEEVIGVQEKLLEKLSGFKTLCN